LPVLGKLEKYDVSGLGERVSSKVGDNSDEFSFAETLHAQ
jgi:hypothetical protein